MNIKNDGSVTYYGDGSVWGGKEIYYSSPIGRWIIVSHADSKVQVAERLTIVKSSRANNPDLAAACVAFDYDETAWVLAGDHDEELLLPEGVRVVWDSINNRGVLA